MVSLAFRVSALFQRRIAYPGIVPIRTDSRDRRKNPSENLPCHGSHTSPDTLIDALQLGLMLAEISKRDPKTHSDLVSVVIAALVQ